MTMTKRKTKTEDQLISRVYKDPKYSGRHIVIIGGKIYVRKTGIASHQLLSQLIKKYPKETPIVTYIPKEGTLILLREKLLPDRNLWYWWKGDCLYSEKENPDQD